MRPSYFRMRWASVGWMLLVGGVLLMPASVHAQSDMQLLFNEQPNQFHFMLEHQTTVYQDAGDENGESFNLLESALRLRFPIMLKEHHELFAGGDLQWLDLDTNARLSRVCRPLPHDLYDVSAAIAYRARFKDGWIAGGVANFGSASDRPFHSIYEINLQYTAFLRMPHLERTAWLFFLHANTNSPVLPIVPGFGYQFQLGPQFYGIAGFPILMLGSRPHEQVRLGLSYLPLNNVNAHIAYIPIERLTLTAAYDWRSRFFSRARRDDRDDRLEYREMRASLSAAYEIAPFLRLELKGGYAFERSFREGENLKERREREAKLGDGWFGGLNGQIRF